MILCLESLLTLAVEKISLDRVGISIRIMEKYYEEERTECLSSNIDRNWSRDRHILVDNTETANEYKWNKNNDRNFSLKTFVMNSRHASQHHHTEATCAFFSYQKRHYI
jgi:hypothetical protein